VRRLQFAAYAAKGVQDSCWPQQNPLRAAMPGCQLHVPALTWQIRLVGVAAWCAGGPDLALGEHCWDRRWPQGVLVMVAARREAARARAAPQAHRSPDRTPGRNRCSQRPVSGRSPVGTPGYKRKGSVEPQRRAACRKRIPRKRRRILIRAEVRTVGFADPSWQQPYR
jgi:hypothetical protein